MLNMTGCSEQFWLVSGFEFIGNCCRRIKHCPTVKIDDTSGIICCAKPRYLLLRISCCTGPAGLLASHPNLLRESADWSARFLNFNHSIGRLLPALPHTIPCCG
jgi:hypothetical protein